MQYFDANIILRYLTKDNPKQSQACFELFQKARRNEVTLTTSEAIIAEVVYVLQSKQLYALAAEEIRVRLYPVLSIPGLKLPFRRMYLSALDLYARYHLDFEDALAIAQMERQNITEVYTYDREYDRMPSIKRLEP
jgi:predicted nucleic acid-binding protein